MAKQDFYELLGVKRDADLEAIKKAYRKLAMQYHPDRNPNDKVAEQKFKDANEAYETLKDPQKRAAYDRFGHAAFEQNQGGGFGGSAGGFGFGGFQGDFSDIFEEVFGGGFGSRTSRTQTNRSGSDIRYNLEITLEDAYSGINAPIRFTTYQNCSPCKGKGTQSASGPTTCTACQGRGNVRMQQGFFTIERPCNACEGSGQVIKDPCKTCHGQGRVRKEKNLDVKIPSGIEDGVSLRISQEGEAGLRGGQAGDLYVTVHIKPHRFFKREGHDIFCKIPTPITTAVLGGQIEVPTIDGGRTKVTIPEGTQTGSQFRLKGKGMSVMRRTTRGDMYIQAIVETPVNLSPKQREMFEKFANEGKSEDNHPESAGFFQKVKEFWDELGGKK